MSNYAYYENIADEFAAEEGAYIASFPQAECPICGEMAPVAPTGELVCACSVANVCLALVEAEQLTAETTWPGPLAEHEAAFNMAAEFAAEESVYIASFPQVACPLCGEMAPVAPTGQLLCAECNAWFAGTLRLALTAPPVPGANAMDRWFEQLAVDFCAQDPTADPAALTALLQRAYHPVITLLRIWRTQVWQWAATPEAAATDAEYRAFVTRSWQWWNDCAVLFYQDEAQKGDL